MDAPCPALGDMACAASPISITGPQDQSGLVGMSCTGCTPISSVLCEMIWLISGRSPENRSNSRRRHSAAGTAASSCSGFVGRREQLAALDDAVGQAATGLPQFVVFSGDAEIGKTRLMTHFAYRIEQAGFWVLRTGCVELGAARLPLVPLKTALRQLVDQLGVEMLRETQAGIDALLRLLPEFGALAPGADDPTTLFDRFGALLAHLGTEHPLLWLIDELHWADRSAASCSGS